MSNYIQLDTASLGNPVAEFRRDQLGVAMLFVLLFGFFGFGAWWIWQQSPSDTTDILLCGGIALGFLGLYVYGTYRNVSRVLLFKHGMCVSYLHKSEIIRWDAIDQIQVDTSQVNGIMSFSIRIWWGDGQKTLIGHAQTKRLQQSPKLGQVLRIDMPDLINDIAEASYPHRLAKAIARYDAHARVDFKTVSISREGLRIKDRTLPWVQVADINADGQPTRPCCASPITQNIM